MSRHRVYGVVVEAARPLPAPAVHDPPDILVREHPFRRPAPLPVNREGYAYLPLPDDSVHVSWSDLFDFVVSADGSIIDVYAGAGTDLTATYTYLITQIISVALLRRGLESLHASAVEWNGVATALVGDSGYGKSTLTAALVQRGARLITDDLLVFIPRALDTLALPGAARLKLHPHTAVRLGLNWEGVPMVDGSGKHVYEVGDDAYAGEALRLERILLLQPKAERAAIQSVTAGSAVHALLAATFNPLHDDAARLATLLRNARHLVHTTRIERLLVPHDFDQLAQAIALI